MLYTTVFTCMRCHRLSRSFTSAAVYVATRKGERENTKKQIHHWLSSAMILRSVRERPCMCAYYSSAYLCMNHFTNVCAFPLIYSRTTKLYLRIKLNSLTSLFRLYRFVSIDYYSRSAHTNSFRFVPCNVTLAHWIITRWESLKIIIEKRKTPKIQILRSTQNSQFNHSTLMKFVKIILHLHVIWWCFCFCFYGFFFQKENLSHDWIHPNIFSRDWVKPSAICEKRESKEGREREETRETNIEHQSKHRATSTTINGHLVIENHNRKQKRKKCPNQSLITGKK